jgi:hypothetical protein
MIFGAITNSWRLQLNGEDLAVLVKEAQARGARHIELRQTCLGQCESGEGEHWRPVLSHLEALVQAFPELSFDLAMAWPCLTRETDPAGAQFQAALLGAKLVGRQTPHLRIVDPASFDHPWERPEDIPHEALGVAALAREAARQGIILSMENSGQPIRSMALLVREAGTWGCVQTPPTSCGGIRTATRWLSWRRSLRMSSRLSISSKPGMAGLTRRWIPGTSTVPA